MTSQPDVEIYFKDLTRELFVTWLDMHFMPLNDDQIARIQLDTKQAVTLLLQRDAHQIELMLTPSAAGKAFTSVWFKSSHTPWANDLECAESALAHTNLEVRCSAESWTEQEEEFSEKWWKLTPEGRELIVWG